MSGVKIVWPVVEIPVYLELNQEQIFSYGTIALRFDLGIKAEVLVACSRRPLCVGVFFPGLVWSLSPRLHVLQQ